MAVRLSDTELHYIEKGAGPPVVLVHGGLADFRLWGRLADALSQNYKVISYSRRGSFPNQPPVDGGSTIAVHSADLASLISHLANEPVHLVGESYGAYVAVHFATHDRGTVRSLVIDEPPILPLLVENEEDRKDLLFFQEEVMKPAIDSCSSGRPAEAARRLIDFLEGSPGVYDSLPDEIKDTIGANTRTTFADLERGLDGIVKGELMDMISPTLLLKSQFGPRILKRVVDILYESIPNRRLEEIKGSTHGTIVDSAEYAGAVLEFLSRN